MKTPLIILTVAFTISFLDGAFMWNLAEGFYMLLGMTMMGTLGYMWYVQIKQDTE